MSCGSGALERQRVGVDRARNHDEYVAASDGVAYGVARRRPRRRVGKLGTPSERIQSENSMPSVCRLEALLGALGRELDESHAAIASTHAHIAVITGTQPAMGPKCCSRNPV